MFYKPDTNQVFNSYTEIRAALLHVLFSDTIDDETLEYCGIYSLQEIKPSLNSDQKFVLSSIQQVEGIWTAIYDAVAMTEEEIEATKPPVPATVTRRQARSALLIRGYLDQVDIVIAAIPDVAQRRLAQIEWQDASEFDRHRDLVIQIGKALGLDNQGLDDLFRFAATL